MSIRRSWLLILCLVLALPLRAHFLTVRTNNLQLICCDRSHSYIIPHMVRSFENSLRTHRAFFDYHPAEPITVLLEDFDDHGYAGATSVPFNYLRLGIEPYRNDFDSAPTNERISWVMNHELVHWVGSGTTGSTIRRNAGIARWKAFPGWSSMTIKDTCCD